MHSALRFYSFMYLSVLLNWQVQYVDLRLHELDCVFAPSLSSCEQTEVYFTVCVGEDNWCEHLKKKNTERDELFDPCSIFLNMQNNANGYIYIIILYTFIYFYLI